MHARRLNDGLWWLGAVDWHRTLFDALIPLLEGTSYNAYVVQGRTKTALIDTVEPAFRETFLRQLDAFPRVDYVIANHAEPDHSGCLPDVLQRYPEARLLCTAKAQGLLQDLLPLPAGRFQPVSDGERLDLGGRNLRFVQTPWVHWPETMVTLLEEDGILFSCDFFGSHLATSELFAGADRARTLAQAKLYYAQIMMPYARVIRKNLDKVRALAPRWIAPSHGPIHDEPAVILDAYADWLGETPRNLAVVPKISTHGCTDRLADRLIAGLADRGVRVMPFDLATFRLDLFASALVDAATLALASPVILNGLHPHAVLAAALTNALKPKLKFAAALGSYGWGAKPLEAAGGLLPDLAVEWLGTVAARGAPRAADFEAVDRLAETIARRHADGGLK